MNQQKLFTLTKALTRSLLLSRNSKKTSRLELQFNRCLLYSTFVSSHFRLQPGEVGTYLQRVGFTNVRDDGKDMIIKSCPFCHPVKNDYTNMYKLYVNKSSGTYNCFRCGSKGSWFDLRQKLNGSTSATITSTAGENIFLNENGIEAEKKQVPIPPQNKVTTLTKQLFEESECKPILDYLTNQRHLSIESLKKYGVGGGFLDFRMNDNSYKKLPCITFPWMQSSSSSKQNPLGQDNNEWVVTRIKARAMDDKSKQRLIPSGGQWGLFGWHTISSDATSVVLTEGEFDAIAVNQATSLPAISLPNGCQSLPLEVVHMLERFSTIYLWTDNDIPGQRALEKFVTKLGPNRCRIVQIQGDEHGNHEDQALIKVFPKDANEALKRGWNIELMIQRAAPPTHKQITKFEELRNQVLLEVSNPLHAAGVQSLFFPSLNSITKGHRRGEFSIFTGATGCGKTTFLSQLSLDLCKQGVNTLWGSFEIKNVRLMKKMMGQLAGKCLEENLESFDAVADEFQALPLYFLRFFGSSNVDEVIDAMKFAVYTYDIEHVILDNLQFMLSGQGKGSFDKFERQDDAIMKFRHFATSANIHISLVIHPRKEPDDQALSISSVFGSAKATQESDNVFILQQAHGKPRLDVKKNRFDGQLGTIYMSFDRKSCRFIDSQTSQITGEQNMSMLEQEVLEHHYPIQSSPFPIANTNENLQPEAIFDEMESISHVEQQSIFSNSNSPKELYYDSELLERDNSPYHDQTDEVSSEFFVTATNSPIVTQ